MAMYVSNKSGSSKNVSTTNKAGHIPAQKIGRNYAVRKEDLPLILGEILSDQKKEEIDQAIQQLINQGARGNPQTS